jgi:hypothetical protein
MCFAYEISCFDLSKNICIEHLLHHHRKIHYRKCGSAALQWIFKVSITIMYKTNPELFFSGILHFFPHFFGFYYIYLTVTASRVGFNLLFHADLPVGIDLGQPPKNALHSWCFFIVSQRSSRCPYTLLLIELNKILIKKSLSKKLPMEERRRSNERYNKSQEWEVLSIIRYRGTSKIAGQL